MFGAFKSTATLSGGYLWKFAPRLSVPQKYRLRQRMKTVDANVEVLYQSLIQHQGKQEGEKTGFGKIDYLKFDMPKEAEMSPRDKYTTFSRNEKHYRKDLHRVPKWTKKSFRENPKYF
ncbi:mitochondrial ribosomal protein L31 [Suhomyces tanzawaensis NRRL Y-17324]|uniref:Large ribosomal subunit protein mL60 n=1 Tax=Suhomyces tanzawaensis NRRL Y-17324 TaxID=984487 RepID=A0A1E4SCP5_9ASCO|nr:mitochondrial ribosomal protein L31 [Suhomyces tanzawaensis NRRL Y-17324]ODV77290.1 mitochondrial ribosomal protein L31 [Suhomyces tanzawaensis NRRL Y-17324]